GQDRIDRPGYILAGIGAEIGRRGEARRTVAAGGDFACTHGDTPRLRGHNVPERKKFRQAIILRTASAMRANTGSQRPSASWRNSRSVGYHGESSRPSSQRQSPITGTAVNTGRASAPARCVTEVS